MQIVPWKHHLPAAGPEATEELAADTGTSDQTVLEETDEEEKELTAAGPETTEGLAGEVEDLNAKKAEDLSTEGGGD